MRGLLLAFCLIATPALASFDHRPTTDRVAKRLQDGDTRALATEALDNALNFAADAFADRGRAEDAERLRSEWRAHYAFVVAGLLSDAGDHQPLSLWISLWYAAMEAEFGDRFMEITHLKDIWVLNLTIPVTFDPHQEADWCAEQLHMHPEDTCQREYARHFVGTKFDHDDPLDHDPNHHGFSGVVTYWIVWGVCEGATMGSGWFVVCSPAGTLGELAIEKWVAPKASDAIWGRANPAIALHVHAELVR